ncbi:hypothetical protein [Pseudomonas sp. GZD-209]|uniref:hypothetical protein n=1 Tax=Pseudomonas sp. GZD-209 TaxID=3404807 RepID=UPI003BB74B8E
MIQLNTHNARLKRTLQAASHTARTATTKQQLLVAVDAMAAFYGNMKFDNRLPWLIALLCGPLAIASITGYLQAYEPLLAPLAKLLGQSLPQLASNLTLGLLGAAVFSLIVLYQRRKLIPNLAHDLAERSSLITAGLQEIPVTDSQLLEGLQTEFRDYVRGNHKRFLRRAVQGHYQGRLHSFNYRWYHLHYVDKQTHQETESDGKGGTTSKTVTSYQEYDRYSLVIDFPWVQGIALGGGSGGRSSMVDMEHNFKTASSDFDRAFSLTGSSAMACARFAKPVTVLHLIDLHRQLDTPNLEFSQHGRLCLSSNDNPLAFKLTCELTRASDFRLLIDHGVHLPQLSALLDAVHTLAEQHDDNFTAPTPAQLQTEH